MTLPKNHPSSMVMTRIGGRDYPVRSIPNCRTCQSPHRRMIESLILEGRSYVAIAREISQLDPGVGGTHPNNISIANHIRNDHMPIGMSAARKLIERRAAEVGKSIDDAAESLIDYRAANELVVQRGVERLLAGEIEVDTPDLIRAIKVQATIDRALGTADADVDMWRAALMAYFEVTQQFMPPEVWEEFGKALAKHPVLKSLAEKQQAHTLEAS